MIGYAFCGSFCTAMESMHRLKSLVDMGVDAVPIMSERIYSTKTRFFDPQDLIRIAKEITGREVVHTVEDAEPFGPNRLDALIIAPCTGNTLAKIAAGISDSAVTMAAKAHLRCDGPLLIALATNDGLSQNLKNIGMMLSRKSVYFVPMRQDSPKGKPHSLVADYSRLSDCYFAMMRGEQARPVFI